MSEVQDKIEDATETLEKEAKIAVGAKEESEKHAKKRQPLMPIFGSMLAGTIMGYILFSFILGG